MDEASKCEEKCVCSARLCLRSKMLRVAGRVRGDYYRALGRDQRTQTERFRGGSSALLLLLLSSIPSRGGLADTAPGTAHQLVGGFFFVPKLCICKATVCKATTTMTTTTTRTTSRLRADYDDDGPNIYHSLCVSRVCSVTDWIAHCLVGCLNSFECGPTINPPQNANNFNLLSQFGQNFGIVRLAYGSNSE